MNGIKAQKIHQDIMQTLKVNLEAQLQMLEEEKLLQAKSY